MTPDGTRAVSGHYFGELRAWDLKSGKSVARFRGSGTITGLAVTSDGTRLVSATNDGVVAVWDLARRKILLTLDGHSRTVADVALTPNGSRAITASYDHTVRVWHLVSGQTIATLSGHKGPVRGVAVTSDGSRAVSASEDQTLRVWDLARRKSIAILEGHTDFVLRVAISADGSKAMSASGDGTLRLWDLTAIHKASYTNAKVLFVGESGAGKSGLVKRLVLDQPPSGTKSTDAGWATQLELEHTSKSKVTDREIWLWDFGGQADYRLIHQLYMDGTALAVFVFDAQKSDAFEKLAAWDRDITRAAGGKTFVKLLVAGKYDVCPPIMTKESIESFRVAHDFAAYIPTSAETKLGCEQLRNAIADRIPWKALPVIVSTPTFRRLKQVILTLKDRSTAKTGGKAQRPAVVVALAELVGMVRKLIPGETTDESDLNAVISLLKAPGAVWPLENSDRVLLQPERMSHYASAVIRTIRDRPDGMGIIPEDDVINGTNLDWGQLERLPSDEEYHVLRAMYEVLLSRSICLREPRPKGQSHLLVFPHLFKLEKPKPDTSNPLVTYRFSGLLDETYATLVVRLHHTDMVEKKNLWLDAADFETAGGKTLGLKMTRLREGHAEVTVYADFGVSEDVFVPFVAYVHEHLKSKDENVVRIRHYACPKCGKPVGDNQLVERARMDRLTKIYCGLCRSAIELDDALERKYQSEQTAATVRKMEQQVQETLDTESKGRILVGHVEMVVAEAGQIFRELPRDHGVDGELEFNRQNVSKGKASAKKVYLQLKSGDSYLRWRKKDDTEIFDIDKEHARHWQDHNYDVWLVVRKSNGVTRWMNATAYLKEHSTGGRVVKQIVFNGEPFTVQAVRAMRDRVLGKA
jgi:small GTP-binding protein